MKLMGCKCVSSEMLSHSTELSRLKSSMSRMEHSSASHNLRMSAMTSFIATPKSLVARSLMPAVSTLDAKSPEMFDMRSESGSKSTSMV